MEEILGEATGDGSLFQDWQTCSSTAYSNEVDLQ